MKQLLTEREYLEYRRRGQEPYHLVDAIKELGFENLAEYFREKRDYNFNSLKFEIIETTPSNAIEDVLNTIEYQKTAILFATTTSTLIWHGNNSIFNEEYCSDCGFPVLPIHTGGGTMVSTEGDLNLGICIPKSIGYISKDILNGLANIFRKYTDKQVVVDKNDILIDGYKVVGSSAYNNDKMLMFITPISLTEKSELVDNICLKKSNKIVGYVDFMDADTLREEICLWLQIK